MAEFSSHKNARRNEEHHSIYPPDRQNHISNLPDAVLSHILSRLHLKDAMRTCVLSKDWELKWTLINNVTIDFVNVENGQTLLNIVERVLDRLENIQDFSLVYKEQSECYPETLVSTILKSSFKSLNIQMNYNSWFCIPYGFAKCTSLTKLDLKFMRHCRFIVPFKNHFPNLESLSLENVEIRNDSYDTGTLIFTFPVLKVLHLKACTWMNVKFIEFHTPSLSEFKSVFPLGKKAFEYTIKIIGARLDKFYVSSGYPENIMMIGSTVSSATLRYHVLHGSRFSIGEVGEVGLQARKLFREISNVKHLTTSHGAIGQSKLGLPLPRFSELNELCLYDVDYEGLLELLHAAPFLKILEIYMGGKVYDNDLVKPVVPSCVGDHLEEVRLFYRSESNFLLEKFLVANGARLKTIYIKIVNRARVQQLNEIVDKLSMFPRASSCLKIVGPPAV